jgi:hypothetical protein
VGDRVSSILRAGMVIKISEEKKGFVSPNPTIRRLRVFALDPSLSERFETFEINEAIIELPWENALKPGPVDDYIEVVDYDPASQLYYRPVDLNNSSLLAQDGLPPSESNPQFHQQMVYAVARNTIRHFEDALGRRALWSPRTYKEGRKTNYIFEKKLRVYPHALREANAYYSGEKKALLFGYFPASTTDPRENLPGGIVFTCLSHDIVAHETTHALLDGLHPRFIEPTNVDVWAFHEAFADIVALFQHFTYPNVLRSQIAQTGGDLEKQSLLGKLAYQFGQAIGHYGALRDALGRIDEGTKDWIPEIADPEKIHRVTEPHDRGAILVAATFDAFLTIHKWRIRDLLRIASGGTGILPKGEIHPDLVNRLSKEASKTSGHVLNMCIRALDYCPPVDIDYGDYLRALITADFDLVKDDNLNYRLAVIQAYRERGIYPKDVRNLSEDSLLWHQPTEKEQTDFSAIFGNRNTLNKLIPKWGLYTDREEIYQHCKNASRYLHRLLHEEKAQGAVKAANLVLEADRKEAFYKERNKVPTLEIHSIRPTRRVGPDGQIESDLIIEITQRRRGYFDEDDQIKADSGEKFAKPADFIFRGGCTIIVDIERGLVKYCIYKRIASENRLKRMRRYLNGDINASAFSSYYGYPHREFHKKYLRMWKEGQMRFEPFAFLHRSLSSRRE